MHPRHAVLYINFLDHYKIINILKIAKIFFLVQYGFIVSQQYWAT